MVVPRQVFAHRTAVPCLAASDVHGLLESGFGNVAVRCSGASAHRGKEVLMGSVVFGVGPTG